MLAPTGTIGFLMDCAFKPHHGTRGLLAHAHLRMMATAQPFLSGGISKTVNSLGSASVEEIAGIYLDAWRMGLKAVAIYLDGSKGSALLNNPATRRERRQMPGMRCGTGAVRRVLPHVHPLRGEPRLRVKCGTG